MDANLQANLAPEHDLVARSGGTTHWLDVHGRTRLRLAFFPAPTPEPRGTVLLLPGRGEYIEKHLETVAALHARGFAAWVLDWGGQGLSTRPLPDPLAGHVLHFDEYAGQLAVMLERAVLPGLGGRPLLLMAVSMGGLIGAHFLARHGARFTAAVLVAPMIDFLRGRWGPRPLVRTLVRLATLLPGGSARFAPGVPRTPSFDRPFENNRLTTCPARHADDLAFLRANPGHALGGVTWGWLRAAIRAVVALEDPRVRARIDMPVLVATAGDERVVDNRAARRFALRLPRGKFLRVAHARHEILREQDEVRATFWAAVDHFLAPIC